MADSARTRGNAVVEEPTKDQWYAWWAAWLDGTLGGDSTSPCPVNHGARFPRNLESRSVRLSQSCR